MSGSRSYLGTTRVRGGDPRLVDDGYLGAALRDALFGPPLGGLRLPLLFRFGKAGSVYSASLAESTSAADSISSVATLAAAVSEAATAADAVSAVLAAAAALAEAASTADAVSSAAVLPAALSEDAAAADTVAAGGVYAASLDESASATDTVSSVATLVGALAEAISVADVVAAASAVDGGFRLPLRLRFGKSVNPGLRLPLLFRFGSGNQTYSVSITEALALADAFEAAAPYAEPLIGSRRNRPGRGPYSRGRYYRPAPLAVFAMPGQTYAVSIAESASAADLVSAAGVLAAAIAEAVAAADVLASSAVLSDSVSEPVTVTDSYSTSGAVYSVNLSEAASLADALVGQLSAVASLAESASSADVVSAAGVLSAAIAEAVAALDAVASQGVISVTVSEAVTAGSTVMDLAGGGAPPSRIIRVRRGGREIVIEQDGRTIRVTGSSRVIH